MPKPIIAGISGAVAGVRLYFALFCDIRFIAADAKVRTAFARRGPITEYGSAWMVPRLIEPRNVIDFFCSPRESFLAGRRSARLIALVPDGRISPGGAALRSCSRRVSLAIAATLLRIIKEQIWAGLSQSLAEARVLADAQMLESIKSADFLDGGRHFVEHREPTFTGSCLPLARCVSLDFSEFLPLQSDAGALAVPCVGSDALAA